MKKRVLAIISAAVLLSAGQAGCIPVFAQETAASTLPAKLDLRDFHGKNCVTPGKQQAPFGTCWAFGSISTLESNILHKRHGNSGVINPDAFEMNLNNVSTEIDLSEL